MILLRQLALASSWPDFRAFERATREPEPELSRIWRETEAELARGTFWREKLGSHSGKLPPLREFPLTQYEDYRARFDHDYRSGTINSLTGAPVLFWAESSGTTGSQKLFPITPAYKKQFQSTNKPLIHHLLRSFPGLLTAPVLYFAAMLPKQRSPHGIPATYISNYNYTQIPPLLRRAYAFPLEVFTDLELFMKWSSLYAVATDLSAIFAITPSRISLFASELPDRMREYWPYLEGEKALPAPLPPLRVPRERLALLRRAFSKDDFHFREIWPSLQFLCCWKSAICALQLEALRPWLGARDGFAEIPAVDATYSATEGWVNVPLAPYGVGGPIHTGALITEFLPAGLEAPATNESGAILQSWELEPGRDYEILITNKMGMVRYRIGDIVRCTGYHHRSPVIHFAQKAGQELSLGLIRVSEEQLLEALKRAGASFPGKWIFGPSPRGDRLVLYVEREQADLADQARRIHESLCEVSRFYKRDIGAGVLQPLEARRLGEGHALWRAPAHAQSKQRSFVTEAPEPEPVSQA